MTGSFRLFRLFETDVFVHWTWLIVAVYQVAGGSGEGGSLALSLAQYLAVFAIVLMHEFGHVLACRSTGGKSERIILWPLGGVAEVDPPKRGSAMFWSLIAGPLVNVGLFVALIVPAAFALQLGESSAAAQLVNYVVGANIVLLIFNLLPIYPLDGGRILHVLLSGPMGDLKALRVTTIVGVVGAVGLIPVAIRFGDLWLAIIAMFLATRCWQGIQEVRMRQMMEDVEADRI
jgi:Zn-dependent protease